MSDFKNKVAVITGGNSGIGGIGTRPITAAWEDDQ